MEYHRPVKDTYHRAFLHDYKEWLFIKSYYRQLSVVNKIKIYNTKTIFVNPKKPKARANKTVVDFNGFYFEIRKKLSVI